MAEKRNLTTKVTVQNIISESKKVFATKNALANVDEKLGVIIGADAGKSARTIAAEELAARLIPKGAKEALDTLEEIAAWIQSHPDDAAAINLKLTLGTRNVAGYVKATGTYVEGTNYYSDEEGTKAVDTSSFTAGETDVSNYYVAGEVVKQYDTVKEYVEAINQAMNIRVSALENVDATKVEKSDENGKIKVNGKDVTVYELPETVLQEDDIVDFSAEDIAKMLADATFTLAGKTVSAKVNETATFKATAPSTVTVTAKSANEETATVASDGGVASENNTKVFTFTVTGVAAGNTTITVVGSDNEYATEEVAVVITNA